MESRSEEEISHEIFMLIRRQNTVWGEYQRVTERLRECEKEALQWRPNIATEDAPVVHPVRADRVDGGDTYRLNPIADTLTIPVPPTPETWAERRDAAYASGVKFAEDALANKDQPDTRSSSRA